MGKSDMPWSKFYWSDWESDEGLRQCSLAAQGLWMRMLCVCAKGDPPGFLAIRGEPLDVEGVAKVAGVTATEAATLMEELERWGVFSRDRKGRIYSRRMVKDAKRVRDGKKFGKRGGNPTLQKQTENNDTLNPPPKGGDKAKKPEARSQSTPLLSPQGDDPPPDRWPKFDRLPMNGTGRAYPAEFEAFWEAFARNPNDTKKAAYTAWRKAAVDVGPDALLAGAKRAAEQWGAEGRPPDKHPHVQTWINREGWTAPGTSSTTGGRDEYDVLLGRSH